MAQQVNNNNNNDLPLVPEPQDNNNEQVVFGDQNLQLGQFVVQQDMDINIGGVLNFALIIIHPNGALGNAGVRVRNNTNNPVNLTVDQLQNLQQQPHEDDAPILIGDHLDLINIE